MLTPIQGFTYNKFEKPNDWPKLKDTFDYQYENGKLIGGNEHLYLSGPVTYTVQGNPIITDNIASNFSSSNCLYLTNSFSSDITDVDIIFKAKISNFNSHNILLANTSTEQYFGIQKNTKTFSIYNSHWKNGTNVLSTDIWYWFRVTLNGNIYKGYTLQDNNYTINSLPQLSEWRQEWYTYANEEAKWIEGALCTIGLNTKYTSEFFHGDIDLNNTYIKVNNGLWFYGKNYTTKNMTPVPAGLEYNGTTTHEIGWVYTNNELVKGPVNYTKVGNPKIVDGVVSGFSSSDYLSLPATLDLSQNWEIETEFTTGNDVSSEQFLFTDIGGIYPIGFGIFTDSKFIIYYLNASGNRTYHKLDIAISNTKYKVKITYSNGSLNLYINDVLKTTRESNYPSSYVNRQIIFGEGRPTNKPFKGSIDLNNTYIKVNGQPWFGNVSEFQEFIPAPQGTMIGKDDTHNLAVETPIVNSELLSPKLIGPVSYTTVGSPTISNGVASGFSSSDYLTSSSNIPETNIEKYEFGAKFTTGNIVETTEGQAIIAYTTNNGGIFSGIKVNTAGKISWFIGRKQGSSTEQSSITGSSALSANTTYYIKSYFVVDVAYLDISTDGINYTNVGNTTIVSDIQIYTGYKFGIGENPSYTHYAFNGSIDLNETYIKVNGSLWFGKENWTPSTYTDNSIYLLVGHSSDYSSYNELGFTPTVETDSDEIDTYSVTIDNQKIFTGMSSATYLEWDKLALTTGYDITTPSSLKAHIIKISPENSNNKIIAYKCESNYMIKDDKLTWANPSLYLAGPVNYTIVGSPTIVDGVASNFSYQDNLQLTSPFSPTENDSFELVLDITTGSNVDSDQTLFYSRIGNSNSQRFGFRIGFYHEKLFINDGTDSSSWNNTYGTTYLSANTNYQIKATYLAKNLKVFIYINGEWVEEFNIQNVAMNTFNKTILGAINSSSGYHFRGSVNLNKSYIKMNDQLWFYGKNYASANIAPVPSGFSYGNITTNAIGFVDMRTQEFTAAPNGTVLKLD